VLTLGASLAHAQDEKMIYALATCKQSWIDLKDDPLRLKQLVVKSPPDGAFDARDHFWIPPAKSTIFGKKINRIYPDSLGPGVGFSVVVQAAFESIKIHLQKKLGKAFDQCGEQGDIRSCSTKFEDKKTLVLLEGGVGNRSETLFGCYYYGR
jgi:hypothetical protein